MWIQFNSVGDSAPGDNRVVQVSFGDTQKSMNYIQYRFFKDRSVHIYTNEHAQGDLPLKRTEKTVLQRFRFQMEGRVKSICFALLIGPLLLPSAAAQEQIGDFFFMHNQDEFDDSDRSSIVTADEDGAGLVWRCMEDGLNVMLYMDTYYGGNQNDKILVRYRFDRKEATDHKFWSLSTDHTAAFMGMSELHDFTFAALEASTVVVEAVDPLDGERNRFRFGLYDLNGALQLLPCLIPSH